MKYIQLEGLEAQKKIKMSHNRSLKAGSSSTESKLRNVDISDLPCDAAVISGHVAGNAITLAHSLIVIGIGGVKGDDRVDPLVCGHSAAVVLSTLDSATPALGMTVAGTESCDLVSIDRDVLGIVPAGIVELVFTGCQICPDDYFHFLYLQCIVIFSPSTALVPSV